MPTRWPVLLMVRSLDHGGCERDATKIAVGLDRTRFEPHVGVFSEGGFRTHELISAQVPILSLPVRSFMNTTAIAGARKMCSYIRQHRIQLMHALDVPLDIFAAPVARCCRVPVVITSQLSFREMYPLRERIALRLSDRLSDRVVVNSRAVADSLRRNGGLTEEKIFLSYNGVDRTTFHPGPRLQLPFLEGASLVIGTVCVMRPEKRVDWLIESFAQVREIDSRMRLLIVGSGPEISRLTALRDGLHLQNFCHFEAARPEVADFMRSIDIYVNCSSIESFPNALLEAMACGCCVIGSRVGGIPELITHLEDGLTFDSAARSDLVKMLRLAVTSANLREELRRKALITAHERFSIEKTLQRMEGLYQELLEVT